jgi:hypothetical protein
MLEIICPSCGRKLGLPDNAAGQQARCPACNGVFQVPAPAPVVPPLIPSGAMQPLAPPAPLEPAPASDLFDFNPPEPPGVAPADAPADPGLDFADTGDDDLTRLRAQVRTKGAVACLIIAGSANVCVALLMLLDLVIERVALWLGLVWLLVGLVVIVAPSVVIFLAGRMLRVYRGFTLVGNGSILAFVEAGVYLFFGILVGIGILGADSAGSRPMAYVLLVAILACIVLNLVAAVRSRITFNTPAVQEAYRRRR